MQRLAIGKAVHGLHVAPARHGEDVEIFICPACLQRQDIIHVAIGSIRKAGAVIVPEHAVIRLSPRKDLGQFAKEELRVRMVGAERTDRAHRVQMHQHVFAHSSVLQRHKA